MTRLRKIGDKLTRERYWLRLTVLDDDAPWSEVTRAKWIQAERSAGFRPAGAAWISAERLADTAATGGFGNGSIRGRISMEYSDDDGETWYTPGKRQTDPATGRPIEERGSNE